MRDEMAARADSARRTVQDGQSAESKLLEKMVPPLGYGVAKFVQRRMNSLWRDVYRYAPDGTLLGWRRYQSDGIREFNAEGLLVLNQNSQGRCTRAREVRYELEPLPKERTGGLLSRRVKLVPTETIREY